ncbi:hypothetical protein AVEN_168381-1 [Araneus ventricosus]|uniref:Uncharacterized protein n=1 Tax=Araneus ventricosus TaxID=182803 RepID=A0A4Y2LGD8_ARAVE|nr:hypothetical protein AVEN_168381-1 [Araneus ventricosus]
MSCELRTTKTCDLHSSTSNGWYPKNAQEKMKKVLIVLLQNKRILEKDCNEILLFYADFLLNIVKPNSFEFTSFNPKSDSLDNFLATSARAKYMQYLESERSKEKTEMKSSRGGNRFFKTKENVPPKGHTPNK